MLQMLSGKFAIFVSSFQKRLNKFAVDYLR